LARLTHDWEWWQATPAAAAAPARWQERHPCLAGLGTLADVLAGCGRDRTVAQEVADARLAAVVAEARAGDQVAARVALQRVLPGLVRRAAARARLTRHPLGEILDDLVTSAWLIIVEYPLENRPVKIAVNILMDAEYRLYGYLPVMRRNTVLVPTREQLPERPARMDGTPLDTPPNAAIQLHEVLLEAAAAGFSVPTARLIAELYVYGATIAEVAAREGVTDRAIRYRRSAALARLARWLAAYPPRCPSTAID